MIFFMALRYRTCPAVQAETALRLGVTKFTIYNYLDEIGAKRS